MQNVVPLSQASAKPTLSWTSLLPVLNGILFPASCFECGIFSGFESDLPVCDIHLAALERRFTPTPIPGIGRASVVLKYHGLSKKLVQRFKIRGDRHLLSLVRRLVADHATTAPLAGPYDAVVPVPARGQNFTGNRWHAPERFAAAVSGSFHAPLRHLLLSSGPMRKQTSLSRVARAQNAAGAFTARRSAGRSTSVLLVDDVITTGATARACATALLDRGVRRVDFLALAGAP